jgi:hemoglobin-like flavoprotein
MRQEDILPLTEAEVALLKQTFRSMDRSRLAMRFYTSLFTKYPNLRSLFPSDLTELSNKIVSVFELVVFSFQLQSDGTYRLQQEVMQPLRSLGALHSEKGVEDAHYPIVNQILMESIRMESSSFPVAAERAWKLALNHLTLAMLGSGGGNHTPDHATMAESYAHIRSLLFKVS